MTRSIIVIHGKKDVPTQNGKINHIFSYPHSILINISLHIEDINCFLLSQSQVKYLISLAILLKPFNM
jgi:hypothetical protein